MQEKVVRARAAVHAQFLQGDFCVGLYHLKHVRHLQGDSLQCRAGDVRGGGASCEAGPDSEPAAERDPGEAPARSLREEVEDLRVEVANLKADHAALKETVEKIRAELY